MTGLTINLAEPPTLCLDFTFKGKQPDAKAIKKAAEEALRYGLRRLEEDGIEATGTYWEGPQNRREELRVKED